MNKRIAFSALSIVLFLFYFIWWLYLKQFVPEPYTALNDYYADTYGIMAGVGGLIGLVVATKYGFLKSYVKL